MAAAAVSLGLAVVAAGPPGYADDVDTSPVLSLPKEVVLPLGPSGGHNPVETLKVWLHPSTLNSTTQGRATIDISELSGVAEVTWPAACTPREDGRGAECDLPHDGGKPTDTAVLQLKAAAGAHAGDAGVVRVTGHAPGFPDVQGRTRVSVRSGPDVYLHGLPESVKAEPGDTVPLPFILTNRGGDPDTGTIVSFIPSSGLDSLPRYGNCSYESGGARVPPGKVTWIVCVLPPVAPGSSALYTKGLPFSVRDTALIETVETHTVPYSEAALAAERKGHTLVQGTGPDLAADSTDSRDYPPGDVSGYPVRVDVDNTAELALTGSPPARGKKGAVVRARVTLTNQGPADHLDGWNESKTAYVDFRPPPGTRVVDSPYDLCTVYDANGKQLAYNAPGALYRCPFGPYMWAGQSGSYDFTLRIDKVVPDATGTAVINPVPAYDKDHSNNSVKILLNATSGGSATGGSTAGGSGSSGTGGNGGSSGTGSGATAGSAGGTSGATGGTSGTSGTTGTSGATDGDLAATGSGPVALIGAAALGCGLLGGAVLLLLRSRRRTAG